THEQPISYLMAQAVDNPDIISLAAGLVDYPTLPAAEVAELARELLGADDAAAKIPLQYGTTEGLAPLRQRLLEHMAELDGVDVDHFGATAEQMVVSTGSQQLLLLLTELLVDPGDVVITSWPSYFVYTGALESFGAQVRCAEMDSGGMQVDALAALLEELDDAGQIERLKIIYLVDYHQNPTGITLAADRRPQILELVRRYSRSHRILLIEDAAYRELTYEGQAPPSIKRGDTGNRFVALLQTFSKPFSPGLKTGYGLLPADLVEPVGLLKGSHDFGSANLCQHLLLRAMETDLYHRHVRKLCDHYARKRDAMLAALQEHLGDFEPDSTRWTNPAGGLYVWLTLPRRIDTRRSSALFASAMAEGALYVPGAYCYPADAKRTPPTNTIRLSFGTPTIEQIHEGVARLARAVRGAG
ncbi:MAG: PLP-dependent aminotransferase family protein, partial [Phycisphaerae bacterium]|nr:PLP-dependent aminotransferase family protein [Phycisphaerae bacterium]